MRTMEKRTQGSNCKNRLVKKWQSKGMKMVESSWSNARNRMKNRKCGLDSRSWWVKRRDSKKRIKMSAWTLRPKIGTSKGIHGQVSSTAK